MNSESQPNVTNSHTGDMVGEILLMYGIPKHKHVDHVRSVLSISSSQAHKKLKGHAQWEVTQLEDVIRSLKISMSDYYSILESGFSEIINGTFDTGGLEIPCKVLLRKIDDSSLTDFSAVRISDMWHFFRTIEIVENQLYMESRKGIYKLIIEPKPFNLNVPVIAVLDDDTAILRSFSEILRDGCYEIKSYSNISGLEHQIKNEPADAYVLDWIVNSQSVYNTIKMIRLSKKPNAMIIVLTGQVGDTIDKEIAEAINEFDIIGPYSKPLKIATIQAKIDKYFRNRK